MPFGPWPAPCRPCRRRYPAKAGSTPGRHAESAPRVSPSVPQLSTASDLANRPRQYSSNPGAMLDNDGFFTGYSTAVLLPDWGIHRGTAFSRRLPRISGESGGDAGSGCLANKAAGRTLLAGPPGERLRNRGEGRGARSRRRDPHKGRYTAVRTGPAESGQG